MTDLKVTDKRIDGGKPFDWGKTSEDYAAYRDIYPDEFYDMIVRLGLCVKGQKVLDVGTGTGVLPRNMYKFGAKWVGADADENQVKQAIRLSRGMDIQYAVSSAESLDFEKESFDVITACQCFWYFDGKVTAPRFHDLLKKGGKLLVLYMAWLPFEDRIAGESEKLILKYNPTWSGAAETVRPIPIPEEYAEYFKLVRHGEFKLNVPFTRQSWHGRVRTCRGIGASLTESEIAAWEKEHLAMLSEVAPDEFDVLHYAAFAELSVKK